MRHQRLTCVCSAAAALLWVAACWAQAAEGRFGSALDARRGGALAEGRAAYAARPLTIECWAKVHSKRGFQILVAHQTKASRTHWEIYTFAGTGYFSIYLPGNRPAEIKSARDITDGTWHYLAAVLDGKRIRLYVDGRQIADAPQTLALDATGTPGPLAFGRLAEGRIGCDGLVDEVRLSDVARTIGPVPESPPAADKHTIGLWHFDEKAGQAKAYQDSSRAANHATPVAAPTITPRRPRKARPPIYTRPTVPPPAETRAALTKALRELALPSLAEAGKTRDAVLSDWEEQYVHLARRARGLEKLPAGAAEQVFDRHALVHASDRDPLDVILRRTGALLDRLGATAGARNFSAWRRDWRALAAEARRVSPDARGRRKGLYLAACALQRRIALRNPLLDFDRILFVARGVPMGSRTTGPRTTNDAHGQHFATQYFGFNAIPGGGLFVLRDFKTRPHVVNLTADLRVCNGRLAGKQLSGGAFLAPDLSFDGRRVAFSYTENREHKWRWSKQTTWNLFRLDLDPSAADGIGASNLTQLTDSAFDDFDACWLPNGRIVFISERRGGYIRCFRGLPVPNHVMHSMADDGTDIRPISWFETSEWHPSVDHAGKLVYTRWDYTDRENCLGSNFWTCHTDGRDPRAPHGNYPYPWHTFPDNKRGDSRRGRPYTEMNIRAIPGSNRYLFTAAPHHGEAFGSLCVLDLSIPDDGFMAQVRRITPYVRFPESEVAGRSQYPYGTPWPLSEDFYLCNWWENLYLLDRFGNRVLLCENSLAFEGKTNWDFRLIDPIPLRPRVRPPVVPSAARPTRPAGKADTPAARATITVLNVYDTDQPFPPGVKIKYLRVTQNILKPNPEMGRPAIGYQAESTPRIPLGVVPVEADGSAHFEAPVGKELIFQVLDEHYMAVQSMRSVAQVQPGEQLACAGCHENPQTTPARRTGVPLALRRPPSKLRPEVGPPEPITYYRLVQPVFQKTCIPCHAKHRKGPSDMSYSALRPYVFYFAGGMRGTTVLPIHGGSRTIPGRFGARYCRMGRALMSPTHRKHVPADQRHRVILWLDSNSLRLGAFHDEAAQMRGELVWPGLDVDPADPLGQSDRWHRDPTASNKTRWPLP